MREADLEFKLGLDFVDQCDFFERFRILWKRCRCLGAPSMMKYSPGKWLWLGAPELVDLMMAEDLVCHAQLIVVASQADFEFVPSSDNGRDNGTRLAMPMLALADVDSDDEEDDDDSEDEGDEDSFLQSLD